MKNILLYKNSLTSRLILAFMLVAVPAILISSGIASHMVTRTFNKAIENWLRETTNYVIATMKDTQQELEAALTLLQPRFSEPVISFSSDEILALQNLGIDYIRVRGTSGSVLFSMGSIESIDEKPLYPEGNLTWLTTKNGRRQLAFVVRREVQGPSHEKRIVSFAGVFNLEPYFSKESAPSLIFQIIIPKGTAFEEAYASWAGIGNIPKSIWNNLYSGSKDYFLPDQNWSDSEDDIHLFFEPLRNSTGDIQAVFVSGVTMTDLDKFAADASLLFWTLFFGGLLISGSIGYVLARRIVRPIKKLDQGVACIAAGKFGYEVPVSGNDEVAGLGQSFNMMSRELAVMQRDKVQSVKRERARMLGEIAMGFAHEIRNPLLVIKTSAEVLYGKLLKDANDTKLMGFVVEEVERINTLVSEFLRFAKPGEPDMGSESLAELINAATALCQAKFEQHGIKYNLLREADNDTVLCDPKQMQQILLNLILNAVDAMPDGGLLTIRLYTSEDHLCFDVADTGLGISPELLQTIHLPFISTKENGLGLGLAKVYAIIEEHGWDIACVSPAGLGTTFTVCIKK